MRAPTYLPHEMQKNCSGPGLVASCGVHNLKWSKVEGWPRLSSQLSSGSLFFVTTNSFIFCQDNARMCLCRRRLNILDRPLQGKCLESPFLSALPLCGSWAHCSDSVLSFRLRRSIIRGWGLHHKVPSSEEFIQPLPQWVLCAVAAAGPLHPTTSHSLLSRFSSSPT